MPIWQLPSVTGSVKGDKVSFTSHNDQDIPKAQSYNNLHYGI